MDVGSGLENATIHGKRIIAEGMFKGESREKSMGIRKEVRTIKGNGIARGCWEEWRGREGKGRVISKWEGERRIF